MTDDAATFRGSAEAYDRHVGRYSARLGRALIAFAGVRPGDRVLDIGCGPGALTAELARVLGAGAVCAVEPSPPYAAACRARNPGVDVREAGAEQLPFEAATFDAVLSQLVVNFLPDPALGLAEMVRVARPGATVAAAVWDYADGMTLLRTFWDSARALDPGSAVLDEGSRMRFCDPDGLRALWTAAGLHSVESEPIVVGASYSSFDDLWAPFAAGVGPAGAYAAGLDDKGQARLCEELHTRLGSPAGEFELSARAWAVRGRVGDSTGSPGRDGVGGGA